MLFLGILIISNIQIANIIYDGYGVYFHENSTMLYENNVLIIQNENANTFYDGSLFVCYGITIESKKDLDQNFFENLSGILVYLRGKIMMRNNDILSFLIADLNSVCFKINYCIGFYSEGEIILQQNEEFFIGI